MAQDTISILDVKVDPAIKSIGELRENIKALKKTLNETQVDSAEGWEKYQKTLKELQVNQNALKDAAYATGGSFEGLIESAKGASNTYNGLVHRMADLKTQLRSTDVSTKAGRKEFEALAKEINNVNNALKEMDEKQGNFSRNVGNYPGAIKSWAGSLDALDKGLKASTGDLGKMKNGMDAIAVHPVITVIALLGGLMATLKDEISGSSEAMGAVNEAGLTLQPLFKFFKGILDKIAVVVADLIGKANEFITSNGIIPKLINGIAGVGNAILQFVVAPFKGVIEAIKIFKEQGVKGLGDAARAFGKEMKSGVAFKANFEAGHDVAEAIIAGVKDRKETTKAEATKVGEEIGEAYALGFLNGIDKTIAENERKFDELLKRKQEEQAELDRMTQEMLDETNAEIDAYFKEQQRLDEMDLQEKEKIAKAKIATMQAVASATASIFDTMAEVYEEDAENNEKSAKKVKGFRIASATIDTISGAVGAFMQAVSSLPFPWGAIVGAVQSTAVTAAGIAQIAKIKNTNIGGSPSSPSVPAVASAPATATNVPQVRNVTSASEEQRLNDMASDQRVVLVMSDLEVKQEQQRVQMAEASF